MIKDGLTGAFGQGQQPVPSEKQPGARLNRSPIRTQLLQQPGRKQRVTILASLAFLDANDHARAVNVCRFEMAGLVEPQPRSIHRHQKGPMLGMDATRRQQLLHLLHAEDLRPMHRLFDRRQVPPQLLHRPLQHQLIERTQRIHRQVQRRRSQLLFLRQVEDVLLELLVTKLIGRLVVVLGQAVNSPDVALLGSGCNPSYNEFPNEVLT
jgi:hypothetical protein